VLSNFEVTRWLGRNKKSVEILLFFQMGLVRWRVGYGLKRSLEVEDWSSLSDDKATFLANDVVRMRLCYDIYPERYTMASMPPPGIDTLQIQHQRGNNLTTRATPSRADRIKSTTPVLGMPLFWATSLSSPPHSPSHFILNYFNHSLIKVFKTLELASLYH